MIDRGFVWLEPHAGEALQDVAIGPHCSREVAGVGYAFVGRADLSVPRAKVNDSFKSRAGKVGVE